MKTKHQYRFEALKRVLRLNRKSCSSEIRQTKNKPKKSKLKYFSKVSTGNYLVQMIKQTPNEN